MLAPANSPFFSAYYVVFSVRSILVFIKANTKLSSWQLGRMGHHHNQLVLKNHHLPGIARGTNVGIIYLLVLAFVLTTSVQCVVFTYTLFVQLNPFQRYKILLLMQTKVLCYAQYHVFASITLKLLQVTL